MNDPQIIEELLKTAKTIAVVGLSDSPARPSYGVSAYMQARGYRIIPVNPTIEAALGERAYKNLAEVPDPIDVVDVFRQPSAVPEIVDEVIRRKIPYLWLQESVVHGDAAARAEAAGVKVVMDRCILKDHRKYLR
ncbi:MAG: CoA-binding protein [Acidobacteriaceae bacterium]